MYAASCINIVLHMAIVTYACVCVYMYACVDAVLVAHFDVGTGYTSSSTVFMSICSSSNACHVHALN